MRRIFWLLAVVLIAATLHPVRAVSAPAPTPHFGRGTLYILQDGKRFTLAVEIAKTFEERAYGLMFRKTLPESAGMLFMFGADGTGAFWMKNTLIPLSIAFIDSGWRIVDILDMDVEPDPASPQKFYGPSHPYRYALEVNQGFFKRNGITTGARLELVVPK